MLLSSRCSFLAFSALRFVCNAWCLSRRFGGDNQVCPFCDMANGDRIGHYIHCKEVELLCGVRSLPWGPRALMCDSICALDDLFFLACSIDCLHHSIQAHHRTVAPARLSFAGRIRVLARRFPSLQYRVTGGFIHHPNPD